MSQPRYRDYGYSMTAASKTDSSDPLDPEERKRLVEALIASVLEKDRELLDRLADA